MKPPEKKLIIIIINNQKTYEVWTTAESRRTGGVETVFSRVKKPMHSLLKMDAFNWNINSIINWN